MFGTMQPKRRDLWIAFRSPSLLRWAAGLIAVLIAAVVAPRAAAGVELASFEAAPEQTRIDITWETASETNMLGFHLQRATEEAGDYERISDLVWAIGGMGGSAYAHVDEAVVPGQTYFYRLEVIELSGHIDVHGPISATLPVPITATWTPTPTRTPAATRTATTQPPASSTPSPGPSTDAPELPATTALTASPTPTGTQSPTAPPTSTPSPTPGSTTGDVLPRTTGSVTTGPSSPTPSRAPSSPTPTSASTSVAPSSATEPPVPSPTAEETALPTPSPNAVASERPSQPTLAPSPPSPVQDQVQELGLGWWIAALLLAVGGSSLILFGTRRLIQGRSGP